MQFKVLIRGGGDLATGVAWRLYRCGMQIIVLEIPSPLVIRRKVAFASAVFEGEVEVEGVKAKLADSPQWERDFIPVAIDPEGKYISSLHPQIIVDGIMAKRNLGTYKGMAELVIALGPGFTAGKDVDIVIETQRGHLLGRVIKTGSALPNTGIPCEIGGFSRERAIYSPISGVFKTVREIGDKVSQGDLVGMVEDTEIKAKINGVIRGLIYPGSRVAKDTKIADIDPRGESFYAFTISDKALAIAGGVLEAILSFYKEKH